MGSRAQAQGLEGREPLQPSGRAYAFVSVCVCVCGVGLQKMESFCTSCFVSYFFNFMHYQGLCEVLVAQLCLTFCDPMGYSPPGSSVHGIL